MDIIINASPVTAWSILILGIVSSTYTIAMFFELAKMVFKVVKGEAI